MSLPGPFDVAPERELRLRMALALALVVVLPFALVYTLLFLVNTVGLAVLEWADGRPRHGEFYVDPVVLTVVVLGGFALQYRYGPRAVLGSVGARRVSAEERPALHATVTRLAAQADLPDPDVAVVDTDLPNAFAVTGGTDGTVVVTTGLVDALDEAELEAVLAHELAHLKNRDANLMTVAWLVPTLTYYLAIAAFTVLYGLFRVLGSGSSSGGSRDGRGIVVAVVVVAVSAALTLLVSALFWAGSVLLYRILSRQREYVADRAAATMTGSPAALASALETVDETMPAVPDEDLRKYDGGVEALYLAPLDARAFGTKELISTDIFPETHPPTEDRIDHLQEMAGAEVAA